MGEAGVKVFGKLLAELLDTSDYRRSHTLEGLDKGQNPEVYTLFCGDSRVEASVVINAPLNRLFGNEVIGNQVFGIMGSAAYPTEHLPSVRLVNVMGHVSCGAVSAAHNASIGLAPNIKLPEGLPDAINATLDKFSAAQRPLMVLDAEKAIIEELYPMAQFFANARSVIGNDEAPFYVKHAVANVMLQTSLLMRMPHILKKVGKGEMVVTGTVYDFVGRLGAKGMVYLVDLNGSADVDGSIFAGVEGFRNVLPTAGLIKE